MILLDCHADRGQKRFPNAVYAGKAQSQGPERRFVCSWREREIPRRSFACRQSSLENRGFGLLPLARAVEPRNPRENQGRERLLHRDSGGRGFRGRGKKRLHSAGQRAGSERRKQAFGQPAFEKVSLEKIRSRRRRAAPGRKKVFAPWRSRDSPSFGVQGVVRR